MLERFRQAKQKELLALKKARDGGILPAPAQRAHGLFSSALMGGSPAVIAEYKRASPSRGIIREDIAPELAARLYAAGGASALSILTEEDWFQGNLNFIARAEEALADFHTLPILRKDFIFDPLQVMATAATPAAALLLIVRLTPDAKILGDLRELAEKFNLECVVEIFDLKDLAIARDSGAGIIQVNARDLNTLKVDRATCLELAKAGNPRPDEIWIAASGMDNPAHLASAAQAGFQAALIGSSLMSSPDPGAALAALISGARSCL